MTKLVSLFVEKKNILILDNGDVAAITKDEIKHVGTVQSGEIYIDGTGIGDIGSQVIKERKVLSEEGLFSIIISYHSLTKKLLNKPTIISRGFIYMKGNEAITTSLSNEVETLVKQELNKKMINPQTIKQVVIDHLSQAFHKLTIRKTLNIPN